MTEGTGSEATGNGGATVPLSDGAGNPGSSNDGVDNGSTDAGAPSFLDGLSEGNRQKATDLGWKSGDQVVDSFVSLEAKLGRSVTLPGKDATPDDWQKVYDRLGRPKTADSYEFNLPEGLPETMPYDEGLAVEFKNWAHEAGLNGKQADFMHGKFVEHQAGSFTKAGADLSQTCGEALTELTGKWGPQEGDKYKSNMQNAVRALQNLDMVDEFKQAGFIAADNSVINAKAVMKMAEVGAAMFAEGNTIGTTSGNTENPFTGDNMTKQGEVVRTDPAKAKALIIAAGRNPADYGLT